MVPLLQQPQAFMLMQDVEEDVRMKDEWDWTKEICAICGEAIGREPAIHDDEGGYVHIACIGE